MKTPLLSICLGTWASLSVSAQPLLTWTELEQATNYPSVDLAISEKDKATKLSLYTPGETFSERVALITNLQALHANRLYIKYLPNTLATLPRLQWLELRNNWIAQLPDNFGDLASMRRLDLRGNWFEQFPTPITKLATLEWLDISQNRIDSLPNELFNCKEIKYLDIHKNKIKNFPSQFTNLLTILGHMMLG